MALRWGRKVHGFGVVRRASQHEQGKRWFQVIQVAVKWFFTWKRRRESCSKTVSLRYKGLV